MPSTEPTQNERPTVRSSCRPRLSPHVRLTFDPTRERHILLAPESVTVLNATGTTILELCDGQRKLDDIVAELRERYDGVADDQVRDFLARLAARKYVELGDD